MQRTRLSVRLNDHTNDLLLHIPELLLTQTYPILANVAASITDLKRDPMGTFRSGQGRAIVILNRNEPAFYVVPPDVYHDLLSRLDDKAPQGESSPNLNPNLPSKEGAQ